MKSQVKVITDSVSDISFDIAQQYNITIVPAYIRFGKQIYRDGIDITPDRFYKKLRNAKETPSTSQPSPEDFFKVFNEVLQNSSGIVSIHVSSKLSGTYNSALLAKRMMATKIPIEVIDSKFNSVGQALAVMAAANSSLKGNDIWDVKNDTLAAISQISMFGMFNTMKYLAKSGRVNKVIALAGSFLNVKPLLTFHDGEIVRAGFVRTFNQGIDRIFQFIESKIPISELMIVHSEIPEKAEYLKTKLSNFIDKSHITVNQLGAALGTHGGPGALVIALRQAR